MNNIIFSVGRITPNGVSLLGSAFLLNKSGVFATASHVTNNDDKNLVIILNDINNLHDYQDTTISEIRYINVAIEEVDPFSDLCLLKSKDITYSSNIEIGSADECAVGDSVAIWGFPHADQGRRVLTEQITQIGAKVLIGNDGMKTKHLILNVQARPGQSGGAIFNMRTNKLVGVLIGSYAPASGGGISLGGVDPQTLHQTTHAVSAEYIKEMI